MKLRASFVHTHRTAIKHGSIQCRNSALGFRRLHRLHEGDTAGFARIPVLDEGDGFDVSVGYKNFPQLLLRHRDIQVSDKNVRHEFILFLICPKFRNRERTRNFKGDLDPDRLSQGRAHSEWPYVFSLPTLGALRNVELYGLPFLKTLELARLDCREVHKNILAALTTDEAVAFGVVEPLHCSLFCHIWILVFLLIDLRWRDSEVLKAGYWLVGRELLTTDSVQRTDHRTLRPHHSQILVDAQYAICHELVGFDVPRD